MRLHNPAGGVCKDGGAFVWSQAAQHKAKATYGKRRRRTLAAICSSTNHAQHAQRTEDLDGWRQATCTSKKRSVPGKPRKTEKEPKRVKRRGDKGGLTTSPKVSMQHGERRNKKVQVYLDFGQKNFGRTRCPTCDMLYAPGKEEDEAAHRVFCLSMRKPLRFRSLPQKDIPVWTNTEIHLRHMVLKFDLAKKEMRKRCKKLLRHLNAKLCSSRGEEGNVDVVGPRTDGSLLFVYLQESRVLGLALVRPCREMEVEILQIFVETNHRRKGIASRILDCVRVESTYGCVISRRSCIFINPTDQGALLAARYQELRPKHMEDTSSS